MDRETEFHVEMSARRNMERGMTPEAGREAYRVAAFPDVDLAAFASFALLLAGIGIHGVIASVVQQRRREIGIRLAPGVRIALPWQRP